MALLCRNASDPRCWTDLQHDRSPAPPASKRPGTRTKPFTGRVGYLDLQKYTKDYELCQRCAKRLEYTEFCFGTPANRGHPGLPGWQPVCRPGRTGGDSFHGKIHNPLNKAASIDRAGKSVWLPLSHLHAF